MFTLILLLGVTALFAVNSLISYSLGWLFTERLILPWNRKPFNCRPCLTFWLTVFCNSVFAYLIAPYFAEWGLTYDITPALYGLAGVGVLLAFINFMYIKLKFRIYD